jgi:hypothetical protein
MWRGIFPTYDDEKIVAFLASVAKSTLDRRYQVVEPHLPAITGLPGPLDAPRNEERKHGRGHRNGDPG